MRKLIPLVVLTATFCMGASCSISWDGPDTGVPLDQADCTMRIAENSTEATVSAEITTRLGFPVELDEDRSVLVNDQALTREGGTSRYAAKIPVADTYVVTVIEPTRGVETTSQAAPPDFSILSPTDGGTASLSGLAVLWSNPDAPLRAVIVLSQVLFGETQQLTAGPLADGGNRSFGAADLARFRQGADLTITVTKTVQRTGINGFDSGRLSIERSRLIRIQPRS
ncbi:MAG TPA: hypothetical protein VLM89_07245 [Phycisphaerae bacterium]|nr:hypothetical protein [Phycisphaerae bacterium]